MVESGSGRFVPAEVTENFEALRPVIERFATDHGLRLDRYRKGKPAWELRYARRQGGVGSITLSAREPSWHAVDVVAVFWLDDWETRSRRLRSEKVGVYFWRDPAETLEAELREALRMLDSWSIDDLGVPHGPFKDWAPDRGEFMRALDALPIRGTVPLPKTS
jgi:hypothetical protein